MDNKEFFYSLRIGICPEFHQEEYFKKLEEFLEQAKIDDAMFFLNQEEVNQGHLTMEETKPWLDMIDGFKTRLESDGYKVSINPWTTTLHTDRGRNLKPGQDFTTMVDIDGKKSEAVACPLCENWEKYIIEMYKEYAKSKLYVLWLEDDFRLHNHSPLRWGGCFCDLHMKKFSEKAGKELSREEFIQGLLSDNEVHPYRKIWLDTNRELMVGLAKRITDAAHDVSPNTMMGLMTSIPAVHCAEGRDWDSLFDALRDGIGAVNRPHLPAYSETSAQKYCLSFQEISRLSAKLTKHKSYIWPEIDNMPHTRFSKSHRFMKMQMETSLALCSDGITINIFDMMGNGISTYQQNHKPLSEVKPYLSAFKSLGTDLDQERGVCIMVDNDSSYTIKTEPNNMKSLHPKETFWAGYLSAFGISNRYCFEKNIKDKIVAISGQYLRNLNAQEISDMFHSNYVLLNGDAVETLYDMELSEQLLGIISIKWHELNCGYQSYEQVCDGNIYQGLPDARISMQALSEEISTGDYLDIEFTSQPHLYSEARDACGNVVGNGMAFVNNNVFVLPFGHIEDDYTQLLNPVRQEILQTAISDMNVAKKPVILHNMQYVTVNEFKGDDKIVLLLSNFSLDSYDKVTLSFGEAVNKMYMIDKQSGKLHEVCFSQDGDKLSIDIYLKGMSTMTIVIK